MKIKLPEGREITMLSLQVIHLYAGALEGSPEVLSRLHRLRLEPEVSAAKGLLVLDPQSEVLPSYQCRARFSSLPITPKGYVSELSVIWYANEIENLRVLLTNALNCFIWTENAQELSIDDL